MLGTQCKFGAGQRYRELSMPRLLFKTIISYKLFDINAKDESLE